jgi:hypothetical protein
MKRLFQLVSADEWEAARKEFRLTTKHADVYQVLAYMCGYDHDPMAKITVSPQMLGKKRKVLLQYAARLGVDVQTMVGLDGSLYVRRRWKKRRADFAPPQRFFEAITAQEWRDYMAKHKRRAPKHKRRVA